MGKQARSSTWIDRDVYFSRSQIHIAELDTPDEAMKQINKVFGIKNELRAHQLKNEFLTLDPNNFSSIEKFLSKFNTLRLLLEGGKVKK